jgi:group I intron endonuclease
MGFIYIIKCPGTDKVYIGQTINTLEKRMTKHRSAARKYQNDVEQPPNLPKKRGTCTKLYRAMNKYGIDNYTIEALEEIDDKLLNNVEIMYIAKFDAIQNGYNLKEGGSNGAHSEETRRIIGERTRAAMLANIDKFRTYEIVMGMPVYCVRVVIKGSEGIAINEHKYCKFKSFTIRTYGTEAAAKAACTTFLAELERTKIMYEPPKAGVDLPKGLRKINNGYAVQKIHKKKLYYQSFTQYGSDEANLHAAQKHLNKLLDLWKTQ